MSSEHADPPEDLRRALGIMLTHNASLAHGVQKGDQPSLDHVKSMEDFRKCRYSMDLVDQNIDKLKGLDEPPGLAYVVWRRWDFSERLELLEQEMQAVRNGRKLDELEAERRGYTDQLDFWRECEKAYTETRTLKKQASKMFDLIEHISDARWVIFKLHYDSSDPTVESVLKWIKNRIDSIQEFFESRYRGPHYGRNPRRSSSSNSGTGHVLIVLAHRPRPSPPSGAAHQAVFASTSEDENSDDEDDFGAPLTGVPSNRPPPPPSSGHRGRRNSSTHGLGRGDLPARHPTLRHEYATIGRTHEERSMGRQGTYRIARRYFGQRY